LGYFGSRNIELEFACHAAIVNQSSDEGFFSSAEGRELLARGDEFSAEFVSFGVLAGQGLQADT
jgi:hypothetical protein